MSTVRTVTAVSRNPPLCLIVGSRSEGGPTRVSAPVAIVVVLVHGMAGGSPSAAWAAL